VGQGRTKTNHSQVLQTKEREEMTFKIFKRAPSSNDRFEGIELGDKAKCTLTGFVGVVVALNSNISGCDQVALQPNCGDEWKDSRWFDIERVDLVAKNVVQPGTRRTGLDTVPPAPSARKT
jgi:hypothetical protein